MPLHQKPISQRCSTDYTQFSSPHTSISSEAWFLPEQCDNTTAGASEKAFSHGVLIRGIGWHGLAALMGMVAFDTGSDHLPILGWQAECCDTPTHMHLQILGAAISTWRLHGLIIN